MLVERLGDDWLGLLAGAGVAAHSNNAVAQVSAPGAFVNLPSAVAGTSLVAPIKQIASSLAENAD